MGDLQTQVSKLIPLNSKLLVAVSGGVDSVVLLDLLAQAKEVKGSQLIVAHVDHGLREESKSDADFVRRLAEKYQLPYFVKCLSSQPKTNIEAWGRTERYRFFQEILSQESVDWILTAHTADDQVETILMKFFANRDLTSIAEVDLKRQLLRPLLTQQKTTLIDYANKKSLEYREDLSNQSNAFLRNRIRNQLLFSLEETFGSGVRISIEEQAKKANQDRLYFDAQVQRFLSSYDLKTSAGRLSILGELRNLLKDEYSLAWRVIEEVLLMELGFRVGYRACQRVADVINHQSVACELPSGYRLNRSKREFTLSKVVCYG